ncbi:MAG: O-antigen ligase family protein [Bacteroidetes bacterium]|nr:O-antigen ligase family protein [Bacteroidota bacterium]MBP6314088.1 O-antigen ligase family protein [Chitinophagaceae bacterium]
MKNRLFGFLQILPHDVFTFVGCVTVIVGMYLSRAMISIGMITLISSALLNVKLFSNLRSFIQKPHLLMITGYFLLFALSYFWSDDIHYYKERMQIMIPFLILPFSFIAMNRWELRWYDLLMLLFILLNLSGIGWSLHEYYQQKEQFDIGYGFSKVIPTPFKNDHIRFSLAVVMSICFCVDLFSRYSLPFIRALLILVIFIDIAYIHILSAKTGIVAFYLVALIFIIQIIFSTKFRKLGVASLFVIATLPFIMYLIFPSFKNKIGYFRYSLEQMNNTEKEANISDEGRLISYQYALEIIRNHPIIGVGIGDVYGQMKQRYSRDFQDKEVTTLLPHNQFLMAGVGLGIIGILYLLLLQFSIFKLVKKNDFLYLSFCIVMLFTMMIEPLYETQYGTCIFLFFLLLLMKRSKYYLA